ncbi:5'-nucleotidase [Floccifex sp.]|uniref:5'-nucleotidase n=1 Tax=Floccifex sp. TaxID=2815810 RepID=UPI002A75C2E4|nr:5'-nucleotidase [Floccifex sp.]MDD7281782.1 5'-nucleotidase [Erysipelotrichaceae bacterium]MDY2957531.1 5'-nucleotidase [Floccifex sp.]
MAVSFNDYLVIGISSRALFNLEEENLIFEQKGLDAYREYQIQHENDILKPGAGFNLVKNLLSINDKLKHKYVEVIVMSRNSTETSLRIMNSLDYYNLDIGRMVMSGGESVSKYLKVFDVDLFLSCDEQDVQSAIESGIASGIIYSQDVAYQQQEQIRIAFDADAVLFGAESEQIYQKEGLEAFKQNEISKQDEELTKGPMANFLFRLSSLQKVCRKENLLRTAIVTARDRNAGIRVIKTLQKWNIVVDEIFFLQGAKKKEVLQAFGANIFFDDQDVHARPASEVVPSARVPYKEGEMK